MLRVDNTESQCGQDFIKIDKLFIIKIKYILFL